MAKTVVSLDSLPSIEKPGRIVILGSKWYPEIVASLSDTCERLLRQHGYDKVDVHTLPGSLEMPLAALNDRTPREAVREPAGRARVTAMVDRFQDLVLGELGAFSSLSVDLLRSELGLPLHPTPLQA